MDQAQRRFKIVDKPAALPGCCFVCRGATGREWFVDLGVDVEWESVGAGYVCNQCFLEIAEMVGFLPVEKADLAKKHLQELKTFSVDHLVGELEDVSRRVSDSLSMLSGVRDFLTADASALPDSDENVDATDGGSELSVSEGEVGPAEPSSEQGLADVPASDSGDEPEPVKFEF